MYTYNLLCFGHKMSIDKDLKHLISEHELLFSQEIGGRKFELYQEYHGGTVVDREPCVFGIVITDDHGNENFIQEVRDLKEFDYLDDYNTFLSMLMEKLRTDEIELSTSDDLEFVKEFSDLVERLKKFISENKPEFYLLEVSS